VRKRRYPTGKAFFQVAFGLVFGLLLLPSTISDYAAQTPPGEERLLTHPDPEVRASHVKAIGWEGPSREHIALILPKLKDQDPRVERAARQVLGRWANRPPEDLAGIVAWASALSGTATVSTPSKTGEDTR